jgi:hypothetical protein
MRPRSAVALVALLAAAVPAARAGREFICSAEDAIPHFVDVTGLPVEAVDGRRLTVGGMTVIVPEDPRAELFFTCGGPDWDLVEYERVRVGDLVGVWGSLRRDGTVLAYSLWRGEWAEAGEPVAVGRVTDAAYVDDAGDPLLVSFDVGGETYTTGIVEPQWTEFDGAHEELGVVRPVLPGDLVVVTYVLGDDGTRTARWVTVRQSGEGTLLQGVITAEDQGGLSTIEVDGLNCYVQDASYAYDPDRIGDDDQDAAIRVDRRVALHGTLRDGIVIASFVDVLGDGPTGPSKRRPSRLRALGIVDEVHDGGATVSGLRVDAAPRGHRGAPRALRVAAGDRVQVDGVVREGRAVATRIRRRRD